MKKQLAFLILSVAPFLRCGNPNYPTYFGNPIPNPAFGNLVYYPNQSFTPNQPFMPNQTPYPVNPFLNQAVGPTYVPRPANPTFVPNQAPYPTNPTAALPVHHPANFTPTPNFATVQNPGPTPTNPTSAARALPTERFLNLTEIVNLFDQSLELTFEGNQEEGLRGARTEEYYNKIIELGNAIRYRADQLTKRAESLKRTKIERDMRRCKIHGDNYNPSCPACVESKETLSDSLNKIIWQKYNANHKNNQVSFEAFLEMLPNLSAEDKTYSTGDIDFSKSPLH